MSDLTINQLISTLTQHQVELPVVRQKKQFYVDLFNKLEPKEPQRRSNSFQIQKASPFISRDNIYQKASPSSTPSATPSATPTKVVPFEFKLLPPVVKKPIQKSYSIYIFTFSLLILFLLVIASTTSRQLYCSSLDQLNCIKCPVHSTCSDSNVISCTDPNHILQPSLLRFFTFLPLKWTTSSCVLDTEKLKRDNLLSTTRQKNINIITRKLIHLVKSTVGSQICNSKNSFGVSINEAKSFIKSSIDLPQADFDSIWLDLITNSISDIHTILENNHRLFTTTNPIKSFSCQFKEHVNHILRVYWMYFAGIGLLSILSGYLYFLKVTINQRNLIIESIVDDVFDMIHQESIKNKDSKLPGLAIHQLEDFFLPSTTINKQITDENGHTRFYSSDQKERKLIWNKVEKIVGLNRSIRQVCFEVDGDQVLIWQWVGSFAISPRKKVD